MIAFGRITFVDDSGPVQLIQVKFPGALAPRIVDKIPRVQDYGFSSNPPIGSEAVVVSLQGDPSKGVAVGTNNQKLRRTSLLSGESVMYDNAGQYIYISANGIFIHAHDTPVTIDGASEILATSEGPMTITAQGVVTLNAPAGAVINGNVQILGNLGVTGDIVDLSGTNTVPVGELRTKYNAHAHTGVQTGSGTTATTNMPAT